MAKRKSEELDKNLKNIKIIYNIQEDETKSIFPWNALHINSKDIWPAEGRVLDDITCVLLALHTTVRDRRTDNEKPKWPGSFNKNRNIKRSRSYVGQPATVVLDNQLYVLAWKDWYTSKGGHTDEDPITCRPKMTTKMTASQLTQLIIQNAIRAEDQDLDMESSVRACN